MNEKSTSVWRTMSLLCHVHAVLCHRDLPDPAGSLLLPLLRSKECGHFNSKTFPAVQCDLRKQKLIRQIFLLYGITYTVTTLMIILQAEAHFVTFNQ